MPSGWKYDLITNICSKIVDGDHNPPVAQKQISPYIMLSSKNINEDAITNLNDVRYLSKADFDISNNRTKVTKGDVLFTSVGSIGRTCIYDLVVPVAFQRSVTVMTTYIYNRYFKLFLDSPLYQNYVFENARGTAQKGFYINQIENSLIPIPPYNEQIKIVEITEKLLFFVKKIEEERNNIIENIYRIKSEILDLAISGKLVPQNSADEPAIELLRKINPAFKPCDNSHYEKLPERWIKSKFKDIFKTISVRDYQIQQREIADKGEYPVISQSSNYIEGYSNRKDKVLEINKPVIVFGDHTRIVKYIDFPFIIGADGVKVIETNVDAKYAYYLLLRTSTMIENKGYSRHFQFLSKHLYIIPPLAEQKRIVNVLTDIYNLLDEISSQLA